MKKTNFVPEGEEKTLEKDTGEEDEDAILINSPTKKAKTLQPPESDKPVQNKKQAKDAETVNHVVMKSIISDPYNNEDAKKPDKNDVLRDVSSISSMDAGQNENKDNQASSN